MTNEEVVERLMKQSCLDFYDCERSQLSQVDASDVAMTLDELEKQIPDNCIENLDGYEIIYICRKCKEDKEEFATIRMNASGQSVELFPRL